MPGVELHLAVGSSPDAVKQAGTVVEARLLGATLGEGWSKMGALLAEVRPGLVIVGGPIERFGVPRVGKGGCVGGPYGCPSGLPYPSVLDGHLCCEDATPASRRRHRGRSARRGRPRGPARRTSGEDRHGRWRRAPVIAAVSHAAAGPSVAAPQSEGWRRSWVSEPPH